MFFSRLTFAFRRALDMHCLSDYQTGIVTARRSVAQIIYGEECEHRSSETARVED